MKVQISPEMSEPANGLGLAPDPVVIAARLTAIAREQRILRQLLAVALDARSERERRARQEAPDED